MLLPHLATKRSFFCRNAALMLPKIMKLPVVNQQKRFMYLLSVEVCCYRFGYYVSIDNE